MVAKPASSEMLCLAPAPQPQVLGSGARKPQQNLTWPRPFCAAEPRKEMDALAPLVFAGGVQYFADVVKSAHHLQASSASSASCGWNIFR
jgi:hypothetical protein